MGCGSGEILLHSLSHPFMSFIMFGILFHYPHLHKAIWASLDLITPLLLIFLSCSTSVLDTRLNLRVEDCIYELQSGVFANWSIT